MSVQTGSKREGGGRPPFPSRLFCSLRSQGDGEGRLKTRFHLGPIMRKERRCRDCGRVWLQIARTKCPKCNGQLRVLKPYNGTRLGAFRDSQGVFDDDE